VDITLIQEALALTPQQRIQQNDRVLRRIEELREGVSRLAVGEVNEAERASFDRRLERGLEQADAGELIDADDLLDELRRS
jgi:hypothetical protein